MDSKRRVRYNWNDVVYFLELARHKNLVRTAEHLGVDHTTVSRRIQELERSLNTTLFTRGRSGFALTEMGLDLLKYAEGMESQANSIAEAIGGQGAGETGPVRVASMEGIGSSYLTKCLGEFHGIHPSIQLELITDYQILDLSRREADIFISFFQPSGRRLTVKKIGEFKVSLFVAEAYFADRAIPTTLRELEEHTFVDFIDELVHVQENRWLSDILRPRHTAIRSTSLIAQYRCALEGLGIAMLPSYMAAHHPELVPVMPELYAVRDVWLSVHADLLHVSRIRALVSYLEKRVKADSGYLMPGFDPPNIKERRITKA